MVLVTGLGLKVTFRCGLGGRAASGDDGAVEGSSGVFSDAGVFSIVSVVAIGWIVVVALLKGWWYGVAWCQAWVYVCLECLLIHTSGGEWSHGTSKLEIGIDRATSCANEEILNKKNNGYLFCISTHSSIQNAMLAGQVGRKTPEKTLIVGRVC